MAVVMAVAATVPAFMAVGTAHAADMSAQYSSFTDAWLKSARGLPVPSSGQEVILPRQGSAVSATVTGSGRVLVGVRGTSCEGVTPAVQITVDGVVVGQKSVGSSTQYDATAFGSSLADGTHTVEITATNGRWVPGVCDVNAYVGSVTMEAASAVPEAGNSAGSPGAGNTGVPAGTPLTVYNGDLTITQPGTVIDAMDIRGYVSIKADDVVIKRSIIRGGAAATTSRALVAAWWQYKNFRIEDSTLVAANPSLRIDGLSGSNFSANRLNIYGVVDSVKIIGSNVSVTNSWLHDNIHSENDPNQSDGRTHDDGIQMEGGTNVTIQSNRIQSAHNAAIMITQNYAVSSQIRIANNFLSDGACTVNVTQRSKGGAINGLSLSDNRFGLGSYGLACGIRIPSTSPVSLTNNIWDSSLLPTAVQRF